MTYIDGLTLFFPQRALFRSGSLRMIFALFTVLWLLWTFPAEALPPQHFVITPPNVSVTNNSLYLNLSLTVDSEDGLRDLLKDGAVLRLGISIELAGKRSWWVNDKIVERQYASVLRHDPLTRDFILSLPALDGDKSIRDKNLTRLLHSSWRALSLPVTPLQTIYDAQSGQDFEISLQLSLQHTEVPPWLEKSFVFWSSDVVPQEKLTLSWSLPAAVDKE